jgi:hypothetical protein
MKSAALAILVSIAFAGPAEGAAEATEPSRAAQRFDEKKRIRITALRGEHWLTVAQFLLISWVAEHARITDAGRADVNNRLSALQTHLQIAGNHIDGLAAAGVDGWSERDDEVREAMRTLDAARKAAWRALDEAPRIHDNAS